MSLWRTRLWALWVSLKRRSLRVYEGRASESAKLTCLGEGEEKGLGSSSSGGRRVVQIWTPRNGSGC